MYLIDMTKLLNRKVGVSEKIISHIGKNDNAPESSVFFTGKKIYLYILIFVIYVIRERTFTME